MDQGPNWQGRGEPLKREVPFDLFPITRQSLSTESCQQEKHENNIGAASQAGNREKTGTM